MGTKSSYVKIESLSKEKQRFIRETLAGKKNVSPIKKSNQGIQKIGIARKEDYGKYKIQTLPGRKSDYGKMKPVPLKKSSPVVKKMSGK